MPRIPRPSLPLDVDDSRMLVRLLIYSLLVLWIAFILGLAVRIFVTLI